MTVSEMLHMCLLIFLLGSYWLIAPNPEAEGPLAGWNPWLSDRQGSGCWCEGDGLTCGVLLRHERVCLFHLFDST